MLPTLAVLLVQIFKLLHMTSNHFILIWFQVSWYYLILLDITSYYLTKAHSWYIRVTASIHIHITPHHFSYYLILYSYYVILLPSISYYFTLLHVTWCRHIHDITSWRLTSEICFVNLIGEIHIHVCVYIYIYIYVYIYIYILYIYLCIYIYIYIYTQMSPKFAVYTWFVGYISMCVHGRKRSDSK